MEIEKSLNRDAVSGKGDTGTSSRSFGTLLTWLAEHTTPVFVIGTSNKFIQLPPELIRKGRFDELFWLDLPTEVDRRDIFGVLIKKFKRDPKDYDLKKLAKDTNGFTGSEIEEVIKSAMYHRFSLDSKEFTTKDIQSQVSSVVPQSVMNRAELELLRTEAAGKLRLAADDGTTSELVLNDAERKISV